MGVPVLCASMQELAPCAQYEQARLALPAIDAYLRRKKPRRGRNVTARRLEYGRNGCDGVRCAFLTHFDRWRLPALLQELKLATDSAEVGVWQGGFSKYLLRDWKPRGRHLLVDPYLAYPCTSEEKDKQCLTRQDEFDAGD